MDQAQAVIGPARGREILKRGLSALHEALADFMLVNPQATGRQMGAYFGYSESWISVVTNSDMFKAYFAKRRGEVASAIALDVPKKLEIAAHLATDKLLEMIPRIEDADQALDVFDKVLHRAGYAPNSKSAPGPNIGQQNNVFFLSKDDLQQVKGTLIESHAAPALPAPAEPQREEEVNGVPVSTT